MQTVQPLTHDHYDREQCWEALIEAETYVQYLKAEADRLGSLQARLQFISLLLILGASSLAALAVILAQVSGVAAAVPALSSAGAAVGGLTSAVLTAYSIAYNPGKASNRHRLLLERWTPLAADWNELWLDYQRLGFDAVESRIRELRRHTTENHRSSMDISWNTKMLDSAQHTVFVLRGLEEPALRVAGDGKQTSQVHDMPSSVADMAFVEATPASPDSDAAERADAARRARAEGSTQRNPPGSGS